MDNKLLLNFELTSIYLILFLAIQVHFIQAHFIIGKESIIEGEVETNIVWDTIESVVDIFHAGVKNLGYWFQAAMIDHLMNEDPSILH